MDGIFQSTGWQIPAADFVASADQCIRADTSLASWTLTLPSDPLSGQWIQVEDARLNWADHPLTVTGNGANINGTDSGCGDRGMAKSWPRLGKHKLQLLGIMPSELLARS
jgi:hypothetical protein